MDEIKCDPARTHAILKKYVTAPGVLNVPLTEDQERTIQQCDAKITKLDKAAFACKLTIHKCVIFGGGLVAIHYSVLTQLPGLCVSTVQSLFRELSGTAADALFTCVLHDDIDAIVDSALSQVQRGSVTFMVDHQNAQHLGCGIANAAVVHITELTTVVGSYWIGLSALALCALGLVGALYARSCVNKSKKGVEQTIRNIIRPEKTSRNAIASALRKEANYQLRAQSQEMADELIAGVEKSLQRLTKGQMQDVFCFAIGVHPSSVNFVNWPIQKKRRAALMPLIAKALFLKLGAPKLSNAALKRDDFMPPPISGARSWDLLPQFGSFEGEHAMFRQRALDSVQAQCGVITRQVLDSVIKRDDDRSFQQQWSDFAAQITSEEWFNNIKQTCQVELVEEAS